VNDKDDDIPARALHELLLAIAMSSSADRDRWKHLAYVFAATSVVAITALILL
jgi:hypothetical protein